MAKVTAKPTVRFSLKAWQQIWRLTDDHHEEISAIGIIADAEERGEDGIEENYYVKEFFVPDQVCTSVSTVMDDDSVLELMMDLREKGVDAINACVWWHSHVNMDTGHSGTDEAQIERFDFDEACISIITNKKRDLNIRIDVYKPFRYTFEKCNYAVDQIDILPPNWGKDMIKEHVTKPVILPQKLAISPSSGHKYTGYGTTSYRSGYGSGGFGWSGNWDDDEGVITPADKPESTTIQEVIEALDFPKELKELQDAYDVEIIGANEAMRLYAKWFAKEVSTEEVLQELEEVHNWSPITENEEDDSVPPMFTIEGEPLEDADVEEVLSVVSGGGK